MTATLTRTLSDVARANLKRAGNPFRNYFARNPDDEVCARYHVAELFAAERDLLHAIIDLYRYDPTTHSRSRADPRQQGRGQDAPAALHQARWTAARGNCSSRPASIRKTRTSSNTCSSRSSTRCSAAASRRAAAARLRRRTAGAPASRRRRCGSSTSEEKVDLFPPPGLGRWARRLRHRPRPGQPNGPSGSPRACRGHANVSRMPTPLPQALAEAGTRPRRKPSNCFALTSEERNAQHARPDAPRHLSGLRQGRAPARRSRARQLPDLRLRRARFPGPPDAAGPRARALQSADGGLPRFEAPVVVAFDQLEDLLLARRTDDVHKIAEAFFAGIVQVMHQIDGLCCPDLRRARFVEPLRAVLGRLHSGSPEQPGPRSEARHGEGGPPRSAAGRSWCAASSKPGCGRCSTTCRTRKSCRTFIPFSDEQITRVAKSEPTLRDMLQQFRHLFDHMVLDGPSEELPRRTNLAEAMKDEVIFTRADALLGREMPVVKNVDIVDRRAGGVSP